jgi:hypothetical protein
MRQRHSVLLLPARWLEFWRTPALKNVIERRLNFKIEAPISFEHFWQLQTEMSGTLRDKMARLIATERPHVKHVVADAARRYFVSGTMSFAAKALIVSGRKSVG